VQITFFVKFWGFWLLKRVQILFFLVCGLTGLQSCQHEKAHSEPALKPVVQATWATETFSEKSYADLEKEDQNFLVKLLQEESCPCDCAMTFEQCVAPQAGCPAAPVMANWLTRRLEEGFPHGLLAEITAKEIAEGYNAKPKDLQTKGYYQKGSTSPKYRLVEYADFECAHCALASGVMVRLLEKYPQQVHLTFKHFPLQFHLMAEKAAVAAEAAGEQNAFWPMHNALFATYGLLNDDLFTGHAQALGLNVEQFEEDMKSKRLLKKVKDSRKQGEEAGVNSTPSFFVNGRPFYLTRTIESFETRFKMDHFRNQQTCQ